MSTYPLFAFIPLLLSHVMYAPLLVREYHSAVPLTVFALIAFTTTYILFTHFNVLDNTSERLAIATTIGILWVIPTITITHVYTITQTNITALLLVTAGAMSVAWVYTPLPDITGLAGESGTYWGLIPPTETNT